MPTVWQEDASFRDLPEGQGGDRHGLPLLSGGCGLSTLQCMQVASMPMEPGHPFTTGCGTQDPVSSSADHSASPGQEMCDLPQAKDQRQQFLLPPVSSRRSPQ